MRKENSFPPVLSVLLIVAACAVVTLDAQTFRSGVAMVPLTVTVTDARGKPVTSLADRDFTVLEDGVAQSVSFFAAEQVPLDLAMVIDGSASMKPHLPLVRRAAIGLARALRPQDRATVVSVTASVGVQQALTADKQQVEDAIQRLSAAGDTALYDGLYVVLKEFQRERRGATEIRKQTIVLLSDGLDTASRLAAEDVMELARRAGVNVYVIAMPGSSTLLRRADLEPDVLRAEFLMKSLAREAGGRSFFPKTVHELPSIYAEIADELAHQYELGYLPIKPQSDKAFRRVSVHVENAITRTRSGYYADALPSKILLPPPALDAMLSRPGGSQPR